MNKSDAVRAFGFVPFCFTDRVYGEIFGRGEGVWVLEVGFWVGEGAFWPGIAVDGQLFHVEQFGKREKLLRFWLFLMVKGTDLE